MPFPFTITELENAMNKKVKQPGDIDGAIAACDRMYNATFRSEADKLSSWSGREEEEQGLYLQVASDLYLKETGIKAPVFILDEEDQGDEQAEDHASDSYYYALEAHDSSVEYWMKQNYPEFKVTGDLLVVSFCNYKGEGDGGLGVYELNKHLNVYKSKSHSFNQVN
tara:strand:- start:243 stop:743 length:501 start_codon:yes stop_codon:yes gene_type:complete